MTPKEAQKWLRGLRKQIKEGFAEIRVDGWSDDDPPLFGSVCVKVGGTLKSVVGCRADDLATLVERMQAQWTEFNAGYRAERVKALALDIIKITAEHGRCTEAALRLASYKADEIADIGDEAATMADAMAANGPFSIERTASNVEAA